MRALEPDPVSPADVAACLRVLAAVAAQPDNPAWAAARPAIEQAHRAGKKQQKSHRRDARRQHDRALIAATGRFRDEVPSTGPAAIVAGSSASSGRPLRGSRRCYVCKSPYRDLDADYHMLCPACADLNTQRRHARCDLTGRRAVVTGGRVKIGFHTALKLLRDGASVLVTTRFPHDAARRYAAVADSSQWLDRLWVHGVDFVDLPGVLGLVEEIGRRWSHLDILINNAAQTIQRPADYHREVAAAEGRPRLGASAAIEVSGAAAAAAARGVVAPRSMVDLFPAGQRDETGEPLDLRDRNSWTLTVDDVSPREWLETHVINAFVPFLLTGRLRPLLTASPHADRYVVQVSAMEGSFSRRGKTERHPHTNMAKAGLNMLTRTVAGDYTRHGIHMTSVDTGWVTDERPHPSKQAERAAGFRPPLDVIDGAARVYDPIVRGVGGHPLSGVFLKDYQAVEW
jgi:NAD(P)-dependent dehydrogenase (short-subunit alcohol dehydrogenase family)